MYEKTKYTLDYWEPYLKDIHDKGDHPINVVYGLSEDNKLVYEDISKTENLLVYGSSGSGKSIFLHSFIGSLITCNNKDEVQLVLVDTKRVEMNKYRNCELLLFPIAHTYLESMSAIYKLVEELRYRKSIDNYKSLPRIILIIDEYLDIADSVLEHNLQELLKEGHKYGIHVILSTQLISDTSISKETKDLFKTKLCQAYYSKPLVCKYIKLKGKGDSIVKQGNNEIRVQCLYSNRIY